MLIYGQDNQNGSMKEPQLQKQAWNYSLESSEIQSLIITLYPCNYFGQDPCQSYQWKETFFFTWDSENKRKPLQFLLFFPFFANVISKKSY